MRGKMPRLLFRKTAGFVPDRRASVKSSPDTSILSRRTLRRGARAPWVCEAAVARPRCH